MAQTKAKKQQKAKPSVVYEYVYDMLQDNLDIHVIAYTTEKNSTSLYLANGTRLASHEIYAFETPTEKMFDRSQGFGSATTNNVVLFGHTLSKFNKKEVLKIAHLLCKAILDDDMYYTRKRAQLAQAEADNATRRLNEITRIWEDLIKKMEND